MIACLVVIFLSVWLMVWSLRSEGKRPVSRQYEDEGKK